MKVEVKLFAQLREKMSSGRVEVELKDGAKLSDLLRLLAGKWPQVFLGTALNESGELAKGYTVLVNAKSVGLEHELKDGDLVALLPPVGGG